MMDERGQMLIPDVTGTKEQIESAPHYSAVVNARLSLCALYYPLGFPVEIHTNSSAILMSAQDSWGLFSSRFSGPPLILKIEVTSDSDTFSRIPPAPICKIQGNLMTTIADAYNFVVCDLDKGFAIGCVTQQTAESTLYLRYHILEAAVLSMVASLRAAPLHGACVAPFGRGMLLCGDSGAGKSSLSFAGARAGWAFISDDASYLPFERKDRMVIGNCHKIRLRDTGVQLFPELEGRPVTPRAVGKPSIEIPTAEMPELLKSDSATIESIIFINRREVETQELVPFSKEAAVSWFSQFLYPTTASYRLQETIIHRLLEIEIFELRYTDLDWAIERLESLALTGR
jgi:hypothetical protein